MHIKNLKKVSLVLPCKASANKPSAFYQPQPIPAFPLPHTEPLPHFTEPLPHFSAPFAHTSLPRTPLPRSHVTRTNPIHSNSDHPHTTHSLPSTKDVPILTGKHDWGPWHSAVRTMILNANLLGHIADDPLPGAIFDPGLWPTYPPIVYRRSSHTDLQSFSDWWTRDGLAGHVLTSRLSPSVLGSLPISNGSTPIR
jgi:hypothetical protein